MRIGVVRAGSAILYSEFGEQPVKVGDVVALGAHTLCGIEPEGWITVTTIYLDRDYLVDQFFWQHAGSLRDRLDAQDFMDDVYAEPAQILHLGEDRAGLLMPWLDELVALSVDRPDPAHFYRMQALLFAVLDVLVPFVKITAVPASASQRAWIVPTLPRHRRFRALRAEATEARDLLHGSPADPWTLGALAERVHLSPKQLTRVFMEAYGKTPLAYLTMLRVEHMARLLREGELSVTAAGRAAGWSSRSRAAEAFRQCVGVTPQRYRVRVRAAATVTVDGTPHEPEAFAPPWRRAPFPAIIDALTDRRRTPIRVEVREADGAVFTDIITPGRRRRPTAEPETEADSAPVPALVVLHGDGFVPGEDVAVAVIVAHSDAAPDGTARGLLARELLAASPTREVILLGRISGTLIVGHPG